MKRNYKMMVMVSSLLAAFAVSGCSRVIQNGPITEVISPDGDITITDSDALPPLNVNNDDQGSSGSYSGSAGSADSVDAQTKDVDLQRTQAQQADLQSRAEAVASQFQMSVTSAVRLTALSDQMNTLTADGQQMTDDDRAALADAALQVAGISTDDATAAASNMINGDKTAANALIEKAATNLGMASSAALRTQILPALGVNVGE